VVVSLAARKTDIVAQLKKSASGRFFCGRQNNGFVFDYKQLAVLTGQVLFEVLLSFWGGRAIMARPFR
jgi:hypothetical protein